MPVSNAHVLTQEALNDYARRAGDARRSGGIDIDAECAMDRHAEGLRAQALVQPPGLLLREALFRLQLRWNSQ